MAGPDGHGDGLEAIGDTLPAAAVVLVDDGDELPAVLRREAGRARALGVFGGDGTVGVAAAAAVDAGIPLVVFPGGALNHFARDLGIETIDDAAESLRTGTTLEADVGTIDDRLFVNTASFGSYSRFVEARQHYENRIGKWPAAVVALVSVMLKGRPATVLVDGVPTRIWMIFVGNCAYDPPGFAPATRARLDDGHFDVRLVDGNQPAARLRLLLAVLTGQLVRSPVYQRRLVTRLEVDTGEWATTLAADGETFPGRGRFVITKHPRPLLVHVPQR